VNAVAASRPRGAATLAAPSPKSAEAIRAARGAAPSDSLRVVCADDHAGFLMSVVDTLERAGMRVVGISSTGPGAVETIREVAPDVAVLDFRMPGLSGIEVALAVRIRFPGTRTVILSAYADPELKELALQAGAAAFVAKDSRPEEIVAAVRCAAGGVAR
jgi:two-component system, NarL family, nitrate/nitrite response regulator NarL